MLKEHEPTFARPGSLATALAFLVGISLQMVTMAAAQETDTSIVPNCGAPVDPSPGAITTNTYADVVCGSDDLLEKVRRIEQITKGLLPRLSPAWQAAFGAQEAAFPQTPYNCPVGQETMAECVATAVDQRLQDVQDFAADLDKPVPDCRPSEIAIKDSSVGDAGMSHVQTVYLFEYRGDAACRIRGYPAILVEDGKGRPQWTFAEYSGQTYFMTIATPPLPVTLSAQNRTAWFSFHTASGCDPLPEGEQFKVKVALPLSQAWLRTIAFADATCTTVTVTPVAMISTLLSSIK